MTIILWGSGLCSNLGGPEISKRVNVTFYPGPSHGEGEGRGPGTHCLSCRIIIGCSYICVLTLPVNEAITVYTLAFCLYICIFLFTQQGKESE